MAGKNLLKILFVEDLPSDAELAVLELRKEGLRFEHMRVDTRNEFINALNEFRPDIIISDYMMPSYNGMRALLDAREFDPLMPFILYTGSMNEETAVDCIKAGATDYVIKEHLTRLPFAVKEALEQVIIQKEKRASELLLKENEEKLQSIFSAAPIGIGLVVNRVLMEVNDTFCKMTGYTPKELIGKSSELIYATKKEFEIDGIEKYRQISEKGTGSVETRFKCKNGKILNILLSSAPLDKNDLTKGVTFTSLDITEKKRVEGAFKESQHLFQTLAQVSPVGIFRTNPDGFTTFVNSRYSELTGLSYEKAMGSGWLNAVHPDDKERLEESWLSDFKSLKTYNDEYRFLRPDRSIVWVMGNAVPEWIDNEIVGYIGTITDITERKLAEDKLKSSEERLKILFDYAPDAYYLSDLKGNFIDGNIVAEKLLGYSKTELIGKSFLKLKLLSLTQLPRAAKLLVKNSLGQSTGPDEFVLSRTDGLQITVEIITHPVKIEGQTLVLGLARDISERKRAEEALRESEEKYRGIFENVQDVYYETAIDGTILEVSPSISILSNGQYHREDLIGKSMFEFYSNPGERQLLIEALQDKGVVMDFEITLRNRDSSLIQCSISSKISFNAKGQPMKIIGSLRDISARKKLENNLNHERNLLRTLVENIPDPISIKDSNYRYILNNKAHLQLIGATDQKVAIGKTSFDFFPSAKAAEFRSDDENVILNGEAILKKDEKVFNKKANEIRSFLTSKIPLKDSAGNPVNILTISHDITEHVRTEEQIQHERIMLRTLIDNLPDLIYVKDIECRKVIANISDVKNIGYNREEEVLGRTDLELFSGQTGQRGYEDDMEVISSGKAISEREEDFIDNSGLRRWFVTSKLPLHDKYGKVTGLVGIGHDITSRKQVEADLINAKNKAEESDRLKTAFLHNISHEIRTPMNAIVGFSSLLGEPDLDVQTQQSYIEMIMQGSNQLLAIITDIVDISNIEADLVKIVKKGININNTLKSLCNQFSLKAEEKSIELVCETRLSESEALVIADNTKLTQILTNLIGNAIKFTDEGYVKVVCRKVDSLLEISVSDTGIGIPAEFNEKIFDRFYQVQNTLSKLYEGTGLGLTISKAYVDLMGGKIWVLSEPGKGTTFTFTIPYEKQIITVKPPIEKSVPETFAFKKKMKILVAEDIDSNFKLLTYFLKGTNAEIIRAVNGRVAVEKCFAEKDIDLILMDVKMPEMDGYTAVRLIREAKITIPIIAQTAFEDDKAKALEMGCNGFLSKPFDKNKLLNAVKEYVKIG